MNVLHVINTLSAGGAELHLLTLCRYLKRRGIDVKVACLREHVKGSRSLRADFEKDGIKVINLQVDSRYDLRFCTRVARLIKQERPDILHTHLPRADMAGGVGRFLNSSVAWISSVHGIYDDSWSGRWTLPLFNFLWREADGVVAISNAVKDWLVTERRMQPEKVSMIHYGIETERFRQSDDDLRKRWRLNGPLVGSIGRLEPGKGHDCLIRAMPAVIERLSNASLLIAGHDPWGYGRNLQGAIERLRLREQVRLIGFLEDVGSFLGSLDVFAFASRSEGFGQVVIEAMAAGKPVVASKIPPLTQIVQDRETGLLVEPENARGFAEAIVWLLTHRDQARQMGKRAQERVRSHFSAERMTEETVSLYNTLLRSSNYGLAKLC